MNRSRMIWLIVVLVLLALLAVLILQNSTTVVVSLLFWTIEGPLVIFAVVIGLLGIGVGMLLSRLLFSKRKNTQTPPAR